MKGVAIGILRYIRMDDLANTKIKPNEILLIDGSPNSLPAVAEVITTDFQTPLSHLTILGQNRKIPIMAFKHAIADTNLTKYIGRNIRLKVPAAALSICARSAFCTRKAMASLRPMKFPGRLRDAEHPVLRGGKEVREIEQAF